MNNKLITPFSLNDFQEKDDVFSLEDFHGFLTCDNITIKMIARAKKCAQHHSKILWIEGESGTGKSLLAKAIVKEYQHLHPHHAISHLIQEYSHITIQETQPQERILLIHVPAHATKEELIHLQQKLTSLLRRPDNVVSFVAVITYPLNYYTVNTSQQLAMMRQVFIEHQYEYMLLQPLRNRPKDTILLLNHYLKQYCSILTPYYSYIQLEQEHIHELLQYPWTKNISELQHYCFTLSEVMNGQPCSKQLIGEAFHLMKQRYQENCPTNKHELQRHVLLINKTSGYAPSVSESTISLFDEQGGIRSLAEIEQEIVTKACRHLRGSKTLAAKKLGVGRTTLYRKLRAEQEGE